MKYMGSKRSMLTNGLGEALSASIPSSHRFFDLFTGSGAVAAHVAQRYQVPVFAYDLQSYAVGLAGAVVERGSTTHADRWTLPWIAKAAATVTASSIYSRAAAIQEAITSQGDHALATRARELCAQAPALSLTRAYGGYYFSPLQALVLDGLRSTLPKGEARSKVALAALIQTASHIAASPGHTAQPFAATATAGPYLIEAWQRDALRAVNNFTQKIDPMFALLKGESRVSDATQAAARLSEGDLAFLDPPYSSVHYSRFYHVLESLARGEVGDVSGSGRYPEISQRPSSDYSTPTRARAAIEDLFSAIASRGASAIVTFPAGRASNGLSGDIMKDVADEHFQIVEAKVTSRFSTLGGDRKHREARQDTSELILTLTPR